MPQKRVELSEQLKRMLAGKNAVTAEVSTRYSARRVVRELEEKIANVDNPQTWAADFLAADREDRVHIIAYVAGWMFALVDENDDALKLADAIGDLKSSISVDDREAVERAFKLLWTVLRDA